MLTWQHAVQEFPCFEQAIRRNKLLDLEYTSGSFLTQIVDSSHVSQAGGTETKLAGSRSLPPWETKPAAC